MGRAILFGILLFCAGCRTTPSTNFYQDIKFEMNPAEVRQVVYDHGGTVDEDAHEGDGRFFLAIMRGHDMLGRELTPFVFVFFDRERMKLFYVDYYFLPEQQQTFISADRCREIFAQATSPLLLACRFSVTEN